MNHIQRHANKLYFAGQNENWPLAGFYVHELEEAMEEIAEGHIVDEGINISQLMKALGLPGLEGLEKSIEAKSKTEFNTAYNLLVTNCNTCHQSTQHPYIVIINPTTPALDNQKY
jgi:cytochrome c553